MSAQEKAMRGAMMRMRNLKLSQAWEQWQWYLMKLREVGAGELAERLQAALKKIEEQKKEMIRIKKESEEKYAKLVREVEKITGEKVVVEDHLSVEQTATSRLRKEVDKLLKTIEDLRSVERENEMRRKKIAELEALLADRDNEIRRLQHEVDSIKREAAERYAQLRADIEKITGIKMEVEGKWNTECGVTSSLREEVERLLRTIEELQRIAKDSEGQKAKIRELEGEVQRLMGVIRSLEAKLAEIQHLADHNSYLEKEVQRLHALIRDLEQKSLNFTTDWRAGSPERRISPERYRPTSGGYRR
jgi:chromosome segregation ATPase